MSKQNILSFNLSVASIMACFISQPVSATIVYSNDFGAGAGSEWSTPSTAAANGEAFLGASATGFGSGSNTLSLSNLPVHTNMTLNFDLYIINSWDGNGGYGSNADNWQLSADGSALLFSA